jgi:DNA-binding NarL/FixJ family response regulator
MAQPIRVLIADDHPRSRHGLRALLATSREVKVVGEAADGQEAVQLVADCQPDVVLMDAQMPIMDGLEATRHIKNYQPGIKVLMLTMCNASRADALAAGVDGLLVKGCPIEQLWRAIFDSA